MKQSRDNHDNSLTVETKIGYHPLIIVGSNLPRRALICSFFNQYYFNCISGVFVQTNSLNCIIQTNQNGVLNNNVLL